MINLTSHDLVIRTQHGVLISVPMSSDIHGPLVLRPETIPSGTLKPGIKVVVREADRQEVQKTVQVIEKLTIRRRPILVSSNVFDLVVPHCSRLALMCLFSPDTSPKSVIRKDGEIIGVKRLRAAPLWRKMQ